MEEFTDCNIVYFTSKWFLMVSVNFKVRTPIVAELVNPLVPDAHYSERQDKSFSLQV